MRIVSTAGFASATLVLLASTALAQPCFTPDTCRQLRLQQEQQRAEYAAQQQAIHDAQVAAQRKAEQQRRLAEAAQHAAQQAALLAAQQAEQQRLAAQQAAYEAAQQAEQQRLAAQRADQEAAQRAAQEAAQRVEQQRREAAEHEQERQRLVLVSREKQFAAVREMPEMASYFAREKGDLVFLYTTSSRHIVRALNGDLTSVVERPVLCRGFPTTQAPKGFFDNAMLTATKMVNVLHFDVRQCALSDADVMMFTTEDLTVENGDQAKAIGEAIKTGQLMPLLEVRRADYDQKVIADRNRREEEVARQREEMTKVERDIDDGTRSGAAILQVNDNQSVCTIETDPNVVIRALQPNGQDWSRLRQAQAYTTDRAFISVKVGGCSILIGQTSALRTIREGLRRDGINPGRIANWISPADMVKASAALVKERADKAAADEEARAADEKDRAKRRAAEDAEREAALREERTRLARQAAACAEDATACEPAIACNRPSLTDDAKRLLEESHNALLGGIKVLQLYAPGTNPAADPGNQCTASLVTNRGEMKLIYGWKVINGHSYIQAHAERL